MKNTFKFLLTLIYFSISTLLADSSSFISLDEQISSAQEDFCDLFYQLQDMNIIPRSLNLTSQVTSKNSHTLLHLLEFIKQNPQFSPEKNQYVRELLQKLEQINYIELRQLIGKFKRTKTLTERDKAEILTILHELYMFQAPNPTEQAPEYPFRKTISHILLYTSFINDSYISYEQGNDMLALFLDKAYQELVKTKELYPSCTIKAEDLNTLTNVFKSYSVQTSMFRKIAIGATATAGIIAAVILGAWLVQKVLFYSLKKETGLPTNQSLLAGLKSKSGLAVNALKQEMGIDPDKPLLDGLVGKLGIELISTQERAEQILAAASEQELGASHQVVNGYGPEQKKALAQNIVLRQNMAPYIQTAVERAVTGAMLAEPVVSVEDAQRILTQAIFTTKKQEYTTQNPKPASQDDAVYQRAVDSHLIRLAQQQTRAHAVQTLLTHEMFLSGTGAVSAKFGQSVVTGMRNAKVKEGTFAGHPVVATLLPSMLESPEAKVSVEGLLNKIHRIIDRIPFAKK